MRYFPRRMRQNLDLALLLRCCPECCGDLEFQSDISGEYYACLQCKERAGAANTIGRLASLTSRETPRLPARGSVTG